jgi:hypothetical protein
VNLFRLAPIALPNAEGEAYNESCDGFLNQIVGLEISLHDQHMRVHWLAAGTARFLSSDSGESP